MALNIIQTIKEAISAYGSKFSYRKALDESRVDIEEETIPSIKTYSIYKRYPAGPWDIRNPDYPPKISSDERDKLLCQLFKKENFHSLKKSRILLKMYEDCLSVHSALIPLINLGILYSMDLVGGAPRDFLLNNPDNIKDLDILINLQGTHTYDAVGRYLPIIELTRENIIKKNWCTDTELEAVDFNDQDTPTIKHGKLAQLCLNRSSASCDISAVLFTEEERKIREGMYGTNVLKELAGIIKVSGTSFNYPIDILLSDSNKEAFIRQIDFNLCSVGISLLNLNKKEELPFVSYADIRERFFAAEEFFEDVHNKTITFNTHEKLADQVTYSFSNHLKRIVAKYPDFELKISDNYIDSPLRKLVEVSIAAHDLKESLEKTDNSSNLPTPIKRKNKI